MTIILNNLRVTTQARRRGRPQPLVEGVGCRVPRGGSLALLGASGAGKSLTGAAIAGTLPAGLRASGSLTVNGRQVLDQPATRREPWARVCLMRQDPATALHPLLPVAAQVTRAARAAGAGRRRARECSEQVLQEAGLEPHLWTRLPGQMSGGQRQRAALALALAASPMALVADEPTSSLDSVARARFVRLLHHLRSQAHGCVPALILITHDCAVAEACDQVLVLDAGRVVERGATSTLLSAPRHPVTRGLVRAWQQERDVVRQAPSPEGDGPEEPRGGAGRT